MINILILASTYSMTGIIIWIIVIALAIYAIKAIGRFVFGVVVLVAMIFFSLFMLDNFTNHDLRRYIDIRFYDQTLDDPQAKGEELLEKGKEVGQTVTIEVDKIGDTIDNELGIARKGSTKEWSSEEPEETVEETTVVEEVEETTVISEETTEENVVDEVIATANSGETYNVMYTDISELLSSELDFLTETDKRLIHSMAPSFKTELDGEEMVVENKTTEDGYINIILK